jgi:hypothetical protein
MAFFKDNQDLLGMDLAPDTPLPIPSGAKQQAAAMLYNRIGGLLDAASDEVGVETPMLVAAWLVESSGDPFVQNRAIIRFEVHLFFDSWGTSSEADFDAHFRFGGHAGVPGKRWQNHQFRADVNDTFRPFHGDQGKEYEVLDFARGLAQTSALTSISIGGSQILVSNFHKIGYASPLDMFSAFQQDERFHILGFMDFCGTFLLNKIKDGDWEGFAAGYNGSGNAEAYGDNLHDTFEAIDPIFP